MTQSQRNRWIRFRSRYLVRAVVLVGVAHLSGALLLLSQPGLSTPGYLSALGLGFILFLSAPSLGLALPSPESLRGAAKMLFSSAAFLVLIPLCYTGVNALFQPVCAPGLALGFWVIGPLFGALFGVALGMGIRRQQRVRSWRGRISLLVGILGASALWHLYRLYAEPSVSFYHPVIGYLAGPIYETNPGIGGAFIWHRFWWLGAFPIFLSPWFPRVRSWVYFALFWLLAGFFLRSHFGFDVGRGAILKKLAEVRVGKFVILHAEEGWHRSGDLDRLVAKMDFHAEEISDWLGITPPSTPTHVFLFRSGAQKKRMMGAGQTEIAKPWLNEVYVKSADLDNMVIRHELVHALAAVLVDTPLSVPLLGGWLPNMPLIEGLATAAARKPGAFTAHEWTAMAHELELTHPLGLLLNPLGFWGSYGPLAYTQSASFVEWLRGAHGKGALQALYSGEPVEEVTGAEIDELEKQWVEKCLKPTLVRLPNEAQELARELLGNKPAFRRPCGLELGRIVRDFMRQAKRGEYDAAAEGLERLVSQSGGSPNLRFAALRAARAAKEPIPMVDMATDMLLAPSTLAQPRLTARVRLELADALWWLQSPDAALEALSPIAPGTLAPSDARAIWARRYLLARLEPGDELLLDYLTGRPGSEPATNILLLQSIVRPEDPMALYLYGFRVQNRGLHREAAEVFERVGAPIHFPPALIREAAYRAAKLRAGQGEYSTARRHLSLAASFERSSGYMIAIKRWARFVTYLEAQ